MWTPITRLLVSNLDQFLMVVGGNADGTYQANILTNNTVEIDFISAKFSSVIWAGPYF